MSKKLLFFNFLLLFCLACGCDGKDSSAAVIEQEDTNPIDAYFLPRIENAENEAERRGLQDSYRVVWHREFENIMLWMQEKCIYQEDKDELLLYSENVEALISSSRKILTTSWLDDYKLPPGSPERNLGGNGTRSELNQEEGEIYRDAGMFLIDNRIDSSYTFLNQDYSMEYME